MILRKVARPLLASIFVTGGINALLEAEQHGKVAQPFLDRTVGKAVDRIQLPAGSQLISVVRNGQAKIADGETTLEAGDQVLAILEPGKTDELKRVLLNKR